MVRAAFFVNPPIRPKFSFAVPCPFPSTLPPFADSPVRTGHFKFSVSNPLRNPSVCGGFILADGFFAQPTSFMSPFCAARVIACHPKPRFMPQEQMRGLIFTNKPHSPHSDFAPCVCQIDDHPKLSPMIFRLASPLASAFVRCAANPFFSTRLSREFILFSLWLRSGST